MPIVMRVDDRKMRQFVRKMPAAGKRTIARSLNKAITKTRTVAAREVSAKRNIKVGRARQDMTLRRASPSRPEAAIYARGTPIKVIEVKGAKRISKAGVRAKISNKGAAHLFKDAFIATMASGHVGVFYRSKTKKMRGKDKAAIFEHTLPSVASTMIQTDSELKLHVFAAHEYEKEFVRLMEMEMVKAGAR